jgi:hypothetical protein
MPLTYSNSTGKQKHYNPITDENVIKQGKQKEIVTIVQLIIEKNLSEKERFFNSFEIILLFSLPIPSGGRQQYQR